MTADNPQKRQYRAGAADGLGGIAMLDYRAAQDTKPRRPPRDARRKLYPNRSGFPKGIESARTAAKRSQPTPRRGGPEEHDEVMQDEVIQGNE